MEYRFTCSTRTGRWPERVQPTPLRQPAATRAWIDTGRHRQFDHWKLNGLLPPFEHCCRQGRVPCWPATSTRSPRARRFEPWIARLNRSKLIPQTQLESARIVSRVLQAAERGRVDVLIRYIPGRMVERIQCLPRRLTIIPGGPLFRLSFAALKSDNGRYLIEDYSIHYAPAGGVLKYTSLTRTRTADSPARYVLVANPAGMPPIADGKSLPRLPGSDEEVRKIAQ